LGAVAEVQAEAGTVSAVKRGRSVTVLAKSGIAFGKAALGQAPGILPSSRATNTNSFRVMSTDDTR
jgi:hypothetical protein